uniref:Uncharacterized protein n=1 Tax=Aegilops tauschii subsp. strangulata TaxID=200361 RepID=A0A453DMP6_AEGTS
SIKSTHQNLMPFHNNTTTLNISLLKKITNPGQHSQSDIPYPSKLRKGTNHRSAARVNLMGESLNTIR